jgi:hypothetical protein
VEPLPIPPTKKNIKNFHKSKKIRNMNLKILIREPLGVKLMKSDHLLEQKCTQKKRKENAPYKRLVEFLKRTT